MFTRHETQRFPCARRPTTMRRYVLPWLGALLLLPGAVQALPYHSYVEGSAPYTTDNGVDSVYDWASGSGVSEVLVDSYPVGEVSWGEAHAYSDPAAGVLKARAYGAYFYSDNDPNHEYPFHWQTCIFGSCFWQAPATLPGSGAQAYARSVWQVVSDTLPLGTPVSLTLNISLQGTLTGDPQEDGIARADLRAWLNTPASLQQYVQMDPLDDEAYGSGIINWWQDFGPSPNLWISTSNALGTGAFSESQSSDALPPMVFFPPLPQVVVGDILILETELAASTDLFNDGCCINVSPGDIYTPDRVVADFFNTGNVGITVNTPGVQLAPVPEPQAVWMILAGLGILGLARLARRLRHAA